jgi:hypothetical protein
MSTAMQTNTELVALTEAGRDEARVETAGRSPTTGLAASPGTAVLPKCSTRRMRSFGKQDRR